MKTPQAYERVVVTGLGVISPLGNSIDVFWESILAGRNGAGRTTIFDASTFPTTFDAEVKNYDLAAFIRDIRPHQGCSRGSRFAVGAAAQACHQAGIDVEAPEPRDGVDRERMGVYLGAGEGSLDNDAFFAAIVAGWNAQEQTLSLNQVPRCSEWTACGSWSRSRTWRRPIWPCSRGLGGRPGVA